MSGDAWMKQQLEELNVSFDAADKDKNGSLSIQEINEILKSAGFTGSANLIFFDLDKNKDFKISKEEFQKVMGGLPKATKKEMALRREFQRIDKNKNGTLSKKEASDLLYGSSILAPEVSEKIFNYAFAAGDVAYDEFLRLVNYEESDSQLKKIFNELDKDGSGELSVEEMRQAINSEPELARVRPQVQKVLDSVATDFLGRKIDFNRFVQVWMDQRATLRAEDTSSNPYV